MEGVFVGKKSHELKESERIFSVQYESLFSIVKTMVSSQATCSNRGGKAGSMTFVAGEP